MNKSDSSSGGVGIGEFSPESYSSPPAPSTMTSTSSAPSNLASHLQRQQHQQQLAESLKLPPLFNWKQSEPIEHHHNNNHNHHQQNIAPNKFHLLLHYDLNIKAAAKLGNNNIANQHQQSVNLFNKPLTNKSQSATTNNLLNANSNSNSSFDQYTLSKISLNEGNGTATPQQPPPPISSRPEKTKSIVRVIIW